MIEEIRGTIIISPFFLRIHTMTKATLGCPCKTENKKQNKKKKKTRYFRDKIVTINI